MNWDFCADVRNRIGDRLSKLGLSEVECRQFGQELEGHGKMFADQVAYWRGQGRLIAISWSVGNGHSCWIGREGDDPATYREWTSLWVALKMDEGLDFESDDPEAMNQIDAYLDQFPENYDEMIDFIGGKLAELTAG